MKKHRELIFAKYGGRCAYCGCELQKGWGLNEVENYNPAYPRCNRWKGTWSI